jgi:hypothetical protein
MDRLRHIMRILCLLALVLVPMSIAEAPPPPPPGDPAADPLAEPAPPPEDAMLRLAQLSPNAEEVSITLTTDDDVAAPALDELEDLDYGEVSDYQVVPSGGYTVTITASNEEETVTLEESINLSADNHYTLAVIGLVLAGLDLEEEAAEGGFLDWLRGLFTGEDARDRDALGLRVELFDDDLDAVFGIDEARLRLVHAAPGLGDIDLVSTAEAEDAVVIGGVSFGEASGFENVTATQNLEIHPAGSRAVLVDLSDAEIETGQVSTVFLIGTPVEEMPHEAVVVSDAPRVELAEPVDPAAPPAEPAPVVTEEEEVEEEEVEEEEVEEEEEEEAGTLEIVVTPEDANINVVGPEGYLEAFSGSQTLTGLAPGPYIITATSEGYAPAEEEVELEAGETVTVELTLEEGENGD